MSATAAHTTATKSAAAANPKALPPARSFMKQPGAAGRKLVRLGEAGSRVTSASFALPKEFRKPRRSDYFSPGAAPVLSRGDSVFVTDLPQKSGSTSGSALGHSQYRNAVASGDVQPRSGVIQFAQLPANQVIVPPAQPLHRLSGKVVTTHELKKFDSTSITSAGSPLPVAVRNPLARTFSVDLTPIRVHTDASAQRVVRSLSTRAFAYGNHIFLGPGEQLTDLRLMAHEVAHVVQQSRSTTLQHFTLAPGNVFEQEAEAASAAAVRGAPFTVRERTAPRPQGLLNISLPNPLTWLLNRADRIPGFRMLTVILGQNPINGTAVPRNAANILRALVQFFPGGQYIMQALDNYGIFDRVGHWVEEQINSLGMTAGAFRDAVTEFISSLTLRDLLHLDELLNRAIRIFTTPIDRLISFARRIGAGIVGLIKNAILQPLARLASQTRAWNLLIAVLGRNPITGEEVPRTAETLIGGFMRLIGQEEVWTNLQRSRAVPRAWAWFQGALEGLISLVRDIPTRFVSELRQLDVIDIVILPRAFMRIGRVFTGFLGSFLPWAGNQVLSLLQIIFEVVAPRAVPYVQRAGGATSTIFRNPRGFARNLVRAGVQGFRQFKDNFLNHLRRSLIEWLTGAMSGAGLYVPQALTFREILRFVLSVLGLTWPNLRAKLVRAIGPTAVSVLETTFDFVVTLVREGPAAAWERIRESISNLREMVMGQIMTMVRERIVVAAITMLASSLIPGAGFIRAIISIYDTVMFFVQRAQQIAPVVAAYIDSISAIASGNVGTAANRVETTLARTLTIAISFLASVLRFGRVTDHVMGIVNRLRQPIDQALDRVVAWIRERAQSLLQRAAGGTPEQRLERALTAGQSAVNRFAGRRVGILVLRPLLRMIRMRYQLQTLEAVRRGDRWAVRGVVNPTDERPTNAQVDTSSGFGDGVRFSAVGESHRLWIAATNNVAAVMFASNGGQNLLRYLEGLAGRRGMTPQEQQRVEALLRSLRQEVIQVNRRAANVLAGRSDERFDPALGVLSRDLAQLLTVFGEDERLLVIAVRIALRAQDRAARAQTAWLTLLDQLNIADSRERRRAFASTVDGELTMTGETVPDFLPAQSGSREIEAARELRRQSISVTERLRALASARRVSLSLANDAEKQMSYIRPDEPIGTAPWEMCPGCRGFFTGLARRRRRLQVVADPYVTRIFYPDERRPTVRRR